MKEYELLKRRVGASGQSSGSKTSKRKVGGSSLNNSQTRHKYDS